MIKRSFEILIAVIGLSFRGQGNDIILYDTRFPLASSMIDSGSSTHSNRSYIPTLYASRLFFLFPNEILF